MNKITGGMQDVMASVQAMTHKMEAQFEVMKKDNREREVAINSRFDSIAEENTKRKVLKPLHGRRAGNQ